MQNQGKKNSSQNSEPSIKTLAISAPPSSSSTSFHLGQNSLSHTHTHTLSLSPSLALEPKPKPINAQFLPPAVTNCKQKLEVRFLHNGVGEAAAMAGFGMLCFAMLCFSVARVGRASKPVVQAEGNTKAKEPPSPALPTSCLQTYGAYLIRMYYISRVRWTTGRFLVPR